MPLFYGNDILRFYTLHLEPDGIGIDVLRTTSPRTHCPLSPLSLCLHPALDQPLLTASSLATPAFDPDNRHTASPPAFPPLSRRHLTKFA